MQAQPRKLNVDLGYTPRLWQQELHAARKTHRFRVCVVHRQGGKALDVDTLIPLAAGGFKRMGDLQIGDRLLDETGKPCAVTFTHPVMQDRRCLEVEFSDGTRVVCDADHRWHTQTKLDRAHREDRYDHVAKQHVSGTCARLPGSVKTAAEIQQTLTYVGENNHSVQVCAAAEYAPRAQPVPPYILGLWLGDGHSCAPYITTMDEWIRDAMELYAESAGLSFAKLDSCQGQGLASTYSISNNAKPGGLTTKLRSLGILGRGKKRIPSDYLYGSVEQRKALLAGLMDTDGSIAKCGRKCEITLVNRGLSDDLMVLLCGLGLKPVQSKKVVNGADYWRIKFTPQFNPFRLQHKAARYRDPDGSPASMRRFIVAVRDVVSRPVRCITVDSPSSLFLCSERYVPTHNSEAACMELVDAALKATGDLPRFAYISPQLKLGRSMFWPKLKQRLAPLIDAGVVEINEGSLVARFKANKATIEMFGASDPDSIRGNTFRGAVLDEVGLMPGMVWHEIVDPTLAANQGWALFIGTPYGVNLFSELFNLSQKDPTWWSRRWTVYETNALPAAEVQRQKDTKAESVFAREFLCDFTSQSSEQLISISLATEASRRVFNPHDGVILSAPLVFGVDPARFGDDRSVIVMRRGLYCYPPLVFKGVDTMFLANRVAIEAEDRNPDAIFVDEGGVGAGVLDRLRERGYAVQKTNFGSKAPVDRFLNMRSYIWWEMREWLQSGGAIPADESLIRELATPTYGFNGKGQVVLESKDDIKERLSALEFSSPDIADALACTFTSPVVRRLSPLEQLRQPGRQKERYRPFSDEARKRRGR